MLRAHGPAVLLTLLATPTFAFGQESGPARLPEPLPPVPSWTVQFEPSAWYVAPGGRLRLPGTFRATVAVPLEDIDIDNPRLSPFAEVHVRSGRWRFSGSGFSFSMGEHTAEATKPGHVGDASFNAGDTVESQFDFQSFEASAGYRVFEEAMNPSGGVYAMVFGLDLFAGGRVYDMTFSVERPPFTLEDTNEFFAEPIIGLRVEAEVYKAFTLDLTTSLGAQPFGDRTSYSWDIILGGVWRPFENFGVQIGYRQLLFDLQNGTDAQEFRFQGGMAGLYGGIELRF